MTRATWPLGILLACIVASGCATSPRTDYTLYRQHMPRSIAVLPPLNQTSKLEATYAYLSTVTYPLAELGYYVYPVAVVDAMMKENGAPTAGEMHQIPPQKIGEVLGADAVLYITILDWGSSYKVVDSSVKVRARARLVDTRSGAVLWQGEQTTEADQGNSSGNNSLAVLLIGAFVKHAVNSASKEYVASVGGQNAAQIAGQLLVGPRHKAFAGAAHP
jgi:hypothetical protein